MFVTTMKNVSHLLLQGWLYFFRRPKMLVPVIIGVLLYLPVLYYLAIERDFTTLTAEELVIRIVVFFVAVPLITMVVSLVLIEMIHQQTNTNQIHLFKALRKAWGVRMIKALPVIIVWSLFRYVLVAAKLVFAPKRFGDNRYSQHSREVSTSRSGRRFIDVYEVAMWEGGNNQFTNAFRRGLRPFFMLYLTTMSLEKGLKKPLNLASDAYMHQVGIIKTAYGMNSFILLVLHLPVLLMIGFLPSVMNYNLMMVLIFAYLGFMWFSLMLVKQMLMSSLYLWYARWKETVKTDELEGKESSPFYNTDKPEFLYYLYAIYFAELDKDRIDEVDPL